MRILSALRKSPTAVLGLLAIGTLLMREIEAPSPGGLNAAPLVLQEVGQEKQEKTEEKKEEPAKDAPAKETAEEKAAEKSEDKAAEKVAEKPVERKVTPREKPAAKKQLRWLALSGSYEDIATPGGIDPTELLLGGSLSKPKSFFKLCDYLDEMAAEENLVYVLFDLSDANLSFNTAQLDELTRRLERFKAKGKKTIAWLENAANVHLAIASQCDEVILADFGSIDMPSSSMNTMFYREAMDLVGVKASVVRAGDFKGAVEPYMNPMMSEHLKDHYLKMLESINASQVSRIAKGRGLTTAAVRELQKKRMLLPADALAAGLVDKLAPYGSMKKTVTELVGAELEWTRPKSKPKREMSLFELIGKSMAGPKESTTKLREDSIVVLHMQGAIVDGKSASPGDIVSGPMVKAIEELTQDDKVKGVVVRVNSPGGSATASEAIRQALAELAKKKPVVFSMGSVAASGGYWITCIGEPIYAEHGTITGSIGVFSLKLSFGSLMRRVGIHVESVALDPTASSDAVDRAWSDEEIANMQRFIDAVYDKFLAYASDSRKLSVDKLKGLAGGRVWSGDQAKQAGLIDEIGGVDDCLTIVAKKAQVSKYKVVHRPDAPSGMSLLDLLSDSDDEAEVYAPMVREVESRIEQSLGGLGFRLDTLRTLLRYSQPRGRSMPTIWAMMPDELLVK
ncbi:MAG: signal peptide peptidase SppA [Pirellula sp.]|nr:signal peptide peptidase SppA [Pirellula sp.]